VNIPPGRMEASWQKLPRQEEHCWLFLQGVAIEVDRPKAFLEQNGFQNVLNGGTWNKCQPMCLIKFVIKWKKSIDPHF